VSEVLQKFEVQVHQLTPNVVVALAKYVWAMTSYRGQPSVEVFAKQYCLHWQKRKIGHKIAQFGSCTFTPKSGKTLMEVVELVPVPKISGATGGTTGSRFQRLKSKTTQGSLLPLCALIIMWHTRHLKWRRMMRMKRALRIAARTSSGRDLVEEFIGYGVWPLAHGWALGEVCPREIPFLGGRKVQSPLFALDARGRDPAAVVREAEDGALRIVGRYVPKTEA
jgi:hypothetical protein